MTVKVIMKEMPAFPTVLYDYGGEADGMTLRDYFAARAMQADMSTFSEDIMYENAEWFEARAMKWYEVAGAMMKAREK